MSIFSENTLQLARNLSLFHGSYNLFRKSRRLSASTPFHLYYRLELHEIVSHKMAARRQQCSSLLSIFVRKFCLIFCSGNSQVNKTTSSDIKALSAKNYFQILIVSPSAKVKGHTNVNRLSSSQHEVYSQLPLTLSNSGPKPLMNTKGYMKHNKETLSQSRRKRSNHRKFSKRKQNA